MKRMITICALALAAGAAHAGDRESILGTLADTPALSTLRAALDAAGLAETLDGDGAFTLYAPTDAAFAALPDGTLEVLLLPENKDQLTDILLYHVDDRRLTTHDYIYGPEHYRPLLADAQHCITRTETVTIADGSGTPARVTEADITAANGVIHIIDKVLLPGDPPPCHM